MTGEDGHVYLVVEAKPLMLRFILLVPVALPFCWDGQAMIESQPPE